MPRRNGLFLLGCACCALVLARIGFGQEKRDNAKKPEPARRAEAKPDEKGQARGGEAGMDDAIEKMMEYGTPGPHHKQLDALAVPR